MTHWVRETMSYRREIKEIKTTAVRLDFKSVFECCIQHCRILSSQSCSVQHFSQYIWNQMSIFQQFNFSL